MIRKDDVQWWLLEAKKHPQSVPAIIEELAKRLVELDAENERLRGELIQRQQRAPAAVDTAEVTALRRRVAELQELLEGQAANEPSLVALSGALQSARLPLVQAQQMAYEGRPLLSRQAALRLRRLLIARPHDELTLLTSQGRGLRLSLADVPPLGEGQDWPAAAAQPLEGDEWLSAAVATGKPPHFWTLVTRRGHVRQWLRIGLERERAQGHRLVESPLRRDEPLALVDGDRGDLLLVTRWGKAVRFPQQAIPAQGTVAVELEPDDEVVAALPLSAEAELLVVTASGSAMRRETAQLPARSQPGSAGSPLIQAFDVLVAFPFDAQSALLYVTYAGKLGALPLADVPLQQRVGKGTLLRDLSRDPAVAMVLLPPASS